MIALDQAIETLLRQASPVSRVETVATLDALGRVLAEPVVSGIAVPPLDNSEMDGYAVRSADLTHVPASLPVSQRIQAGQVGQPLAAGSAARIFTGAPIPAGCDAIVPQEATQLQADRVVVLAMPTPGQWIRPAGMDIAAGAKVLARGTRLRPPHVGLAASVGLANLTVYRRLKVGVLFTGDELAMPGDPLPEGRIYNSNRFLLSALLRGLGCEVIDLGIVPDRLEPTRQALVRAAEQADLVISCGGVSVGEADYVRAAVQAEGAIDLWQIAMKPGKPLAFGQVRGVPFIGLPGNPVSGLVTFAMLARPFILKRQGAIELLPRAIPMRADFEVRQAGARRELLRVRVTDQGCLQAFAVQNSAVLTSAAWADGLADIEVGRRVARGDEVPYLPFSELFG
ncbi:MAG: molybdopterin molybdotransferase MoeA [Betaproteobacteria bacterium]|nr:MAG: molybdopterin molybdotransferase MoeA [Betaproteobacteria bacterium]